MFIEVLALICLVLFIIFRFYLSWNFNYWTKRHIVGPRPTLLSGTFPKSTSGQCNLIEELHEIYLKYKTKHKFVGVFSARSPKLFVLDPALATQILTQHFKHFHDNVSSLWTTPNVEQMRFCSPFVATGTDWKERRAELSPVLTTNRLRAFYLPMCESAGKLVKFVESNLGKPLDVKQLANRYTAEFMANFIWGIEADAFSNTTPAVIHQMANTMITQSSACVRYYSRTAAWPWLRKFKPVRFFPEISDNFFKRLAVDVLQSRKDSSLDRCDVINHLLQLKDKKSLNYTQIAGHTTTVLIDGFETVAIAIAHCLLLLARNEQAQEKLRAEIINSGTDITFDELSDLPYLDQCLQETLRIFPPLPTLFKLCTEAITLEDVDGTEVNLKPNDVVYISSYSFHRDPDYYENPEEFKPERFDEDLGGVRKFKDLGVFLPFGDGSRICLGMKLGMAEAKVAVAEVVRSFQLKCSEQTRQDNKIAAVSFLLSLDGDIKISFEKL